MSPDRKYRIYTYLYIGLMICLLLPQKGMGQKIYSTKSRKAINFYNESEHFLARHQYNEAIDILLQAVDKDNKFVEAHLRLAFCYKLLNNVEAQKTHLELVIEYTDTPARYMNVYFSLGEAYYLLQEYDKAIITLGNFLNFQGINQRLIPEAKWLLENVYFAKEGIVNPVEIHPEILPQIINAGPLQYFPVLTANESEIFYTHRIGAHPGHDENIFVSEKDEQGNWKTPRSISSNINTRNNEGTCSISADGKVLILTSCSGRGGFGSCDLYISYKEGNDWSVPVNMGPEINSPSWDSQPSLSADGRKLYFISERPDGYGGRDIWLSQMDDHDEWLSSVNLGTDINTSKDEVSPFIHVNGQTLYFASKGYLGFGGYDLYASEYYDSAWTEPKNLGYPVNTPQDQISLFVTARGDKAYYSLDSYNTDGTPLSMIYSFDIPAEISVSNKSYYVKGRILDANTRLPLKATVELRDVNKNELISRVSSDSLIGEYMMVLTEGSEYALYVERQGYLFESRNFDLPKGSVVDPLIMDFLLKKVEKGTVTILNNIFFNVDEYTLREKSITELEKVVKYLKDNPALKIEISGHTDNSGSKDYNQQLSVKRSESVYNYMIEHSISEARIAFKGYGQTQPAYPNDTEENRSKNRRIEFKIID